ncbi:uncharacterized protein EAE97_011541 [Botrytis byssoidea]|uniref:Uncharacterized protein n=1 Tax=Botrytis byssoidea TaxID=139641 RepID=A0A9P5HQU0_9HELO|nr:uncharacterized protein EAE97_011541 [Botrytis byssoidea]KAF7920200.1 hypothetical protein EAE97_011541 [Botrytis byssoidea]
MPAITRSKSPCKASTDQNRASSAADTSKNVAPVANKKAPAKEAIAGANNALSDAMVPALAPLSPSKRKRSSKTLNGDEGIGAKPSSEPLKRTRVEKSDASRSHPTSGQPDLAATTYPQVERVILGLEVTPVFGATGGAPKEGLDAAASTPTSSPKSVETTAAAPVLDGEENGVMAKAPISAATVAAGQVDDETVLEQHSTHPAADPADPLTANEAEAHLPAATQGCSASDREIAKEELDAPKIGCKCDKLATKDQKIAQLKADLRETKADLRESQADVDRAKAVFQREYEAAVRETDAIEIKEQRAQKENSRLKKELERVLESNHELRSDRNRFSAQIRELSQQYDGLKRENEQLSQKNGVLMEDINKFHNALDVFNSQAPLLTSDQEELKRTRKLLKAATVKVAEYEGEHQDAERFFAARKVVKSIEPVDPAQGGMSHDNHNREEQAQENRSRDFRTPTPDNNSGMKGAQKSQPTSGLVGFREPPRWECRHDRGFDGNTCAHCGVHVLFDGHPEFDRDRSIAPADESLFDSSDEGERDRESASYEPAEAVINTQDGFQQGGSPDLPGKEDHEDDGEEDGSLDGVSPVASSNVDKENDEDDEPQFLGSRVLSGNGDEENDEEDTSQYETPPVLPDYEYYESQDQQDHQEPPHHAAEVEKTTAAPSDSLTSPSPSPSRKRKESPVSASSPAKKVKVTEIDLAGPSSTAAPDKASFFKPAHPGWGSPSVLSPQVAVTAPAPSTPSSASERTTAAPLFPTVITRSGAAVQFGAATTFGAFGAARSSARFGTTNSFGVPAFAASPKVDDAEDKPADEKK